MRRFIASSVLACLVSGASAQTEMQTFSYDWSKGDPFPTITFEAFDDQGGTRQLTGVKLLLEGDYFIVAAAENLGDTPIAFGDWVVEYGYATFVDAGDDLFVPPLAGAFTSGTAAMGAADGTAGSGDDYAILEPIGGPAMGMYAFEPDAWGAFSSGADIPLTLQFLGDVALPPPPPFVSFEFESMQMTGDLSLEYAYRLVPAPGVPVMVGTGMLLGLRRRRG